MRADLSLRYSDSTIDWGLRYGTDPLWIRDHYHFHHHILDEPDSEDLLCGRSIEYPTLRGDLSSSHHLSTGV